MCGFCCYFHLDQSKNDYPNLDLDKALDYIHHRGPDSCGKFISPDGRCGLGHVRLSVIDLNGGHQPLGNVSGNIQSVVNGELYEFERIRSELVDKGHAFKTLCDSEIALHLYEEYGLSFLDKLVGEFALTIYDAKKNLFIAARDRYGIKPVYYTVSNGTLLVASEIKSFIPLNWKAEWDIDSIVHNGPMTDMRTCFKGVYKLPPAHYLVADLSGSIQIRRYWDADYPDKNLKETRTIDEMVQGVHDHLLESVRIRLRADVPVGIYLSGGLDSSSITGIASKLLREQNPNAKIKAFTISFKDSYEFDESEIAQRTAEFCNADFEKLVLEEKDLLTHFEESIWHLEQPLFNLNGVGKFLLSQFVRDQGYKVVLTGEGSDEHFGGYDMFHTDYLREPDNATPGGFGTLTSEQRSAKLQMIKNQRFQNYTNEAGNIYDEAREILNNIGTHVILGIGLSLNEKYYPKEILSQTGAPNPALATAEFVDSTARTKAFTKWHTLHTALYVENHTFFPNYLCNALGDRSEMAHSIEARTPFLDHRLCEYVNSLPPSLKIKAVKDGSLNEKWILKEAVKPYITKEIYTRTKHPYLAPSSQGRNEAVINLLNKLINREKLDQLGWANTERVLQAKEQFMLTGAKVLFQDMLILMSYVVLSDRFNVTTFK